MLVDLNATILTDKPSGTNLNNYLTGGNLNLDNNQRVMDTMIKLCADVLDDYRTSVALPSVRFNRVNMINNVGRLVAGVIIDDVVLRSYYNPKEKRGLQFHVNATMAVISWEKDRRHFKGSLTSVYVGNVPLFIPDKLKDSELYFSDYKIFRFLNNNKYGVPPHNVDVEMNFLSKNISKVVSIIIGDFPRLTQPQENLLRDYISAYVAVHPNVVPQGKKKLITQEWGYRMAVGLNGKDKDKFLDDLQPFIKRIFYYLCKLGSYSFH